MNPSTQPPQNDPEQIIAYLESIMYQFKDSINAKDFRMPQEVQPGEQPSIWRYMADYFDTEQDLVQKTQATTPGPSKFGLKETLESYKMAGAAYPDFHIEVKEMKTDLDAKAGWATVFVNLESSGLPKEVTRTSVTVFDWKRRNGEWKCVSSWAANGMPGI
ncbi:hypothetical protein PRZ48_011015 [Zasmidium cellare]|uniref:SnoaL-like domain-containing protein n=1 Tax=Zasmidium cellare TaxID=395010 RepID=A0ABR0EA99_ZASCE|nr:hypothetical protein PRZ48_011015 [Zasmidium cellare]